MDVESNALQSIGSAWDAPSDGRGVAGSAFTASIGGVATGFLAGLHPKASAQTNTDVKSS
jgi:hypothetical protein